MALLSFLGIWVTFDVGVNSDMEMIRLMEKHFASVSHTTSRYLRQSPIFLLANLCPATVEMIGRVTWTPCPITAISSSALVIPHFPTQQRDKHYKKQLLQKTIISYQLRLTHFSKYLLFCFKFPQPPDNRMPNNSQRRSRFAPTTRWERVLHRGHRWG